MANHYYIVLHYPLLPTNKHISKHLLKWSIAAGLMLSTVFFLALANKNQASGPQASGMISSKANNSSNLRAVDSAISLLRSGDLVMRRGIDVTSFMLSQMNHNDKTYSHCGMVMIENGYPFVYHSIGGEDNPNACLRRDSASIFFSPLNNLGFGIARYDLPAKQVASLGQIARQFYKERRKFDMQFDLKTDERLYCSEFVYKALCFATADSNYVKPISVMGFLYIGIDNLYQNKHASLVWQVKFK